MTGWRLGWMIVPDNMVEAVEKIASSRHLRAHAGPARRAGLLHRRRAQDLRAPPRSLQAAPRLPAARIRASGTARAGQAGRRLLYLRRHQRPGHGQHRFLATPAAGSGRRPCRAWTSVRPTATPCASPMPPAWTAWKRPSIAWASCWVTEPAFGFHEQRAPRGAFSWPGRDRIGINPGQRDARCQRQAPALGLHLGAITVVVGAGCADVTGQSAIDRAAPVYAILQDRGAHHDVGAGIQRILADRVELVLVDAGHDLHQALRAHMAFGQRVVARLDGDHKSNSGSSCL